MKQIIILLVIPFLSLGQVNYDEFIISDRVEWMNYNYSSEEYEQDFISTEKTGFWPEKDVLYSLRGDDEITVEWEYAGEDEGNDIYFGGDDVKIVFLYEWREIWVFFEYNDRTDRYEELAVYSELTIVDKEETYNPDRNYNYEPQSKD